MDSGVGDVSRRASRLWLWLLAAGAYGLGAWGYWLYGADSGWELVYRPLQLFALEFTDVAGATVPWQLHVARVLAPAVTVLAAVLAIAGERLALWLRRNFRSGYVLVVGRTAEARAVVRSVRRGGGKPVYEVPQDSVAALHRQGVKRAGIVYALGDDGPDGLPNVAGALAAASLSKGRVFVQVKDPELAIGLRARDLMAEKSHALEYFMMDEMAARKYVEDDVLGPDARPEILVVGTGAFGRAIVVAFARQWRVTSGRAPERIHVTLVDENASAARQLLLDRWQVVQESCDITTIETANLGAALKVVAGQPYRAYICYDDERAALRSALDAQPLWHGGPGSLVVRLNELSEHAERFPSGPLFDDLGGRLKVANVAELAGPFVAQGPDLFADLAKAIHHRYLADQLAKGEELGARPSLNKWDQLEPVYRNSNLDQARDLARKLRAIGATIAPRSAANPRFTLTEAEVELLAPMEHVRWVAERKRAGWTYAPTTDHVRKRSQDMVPWGELREESRDKDRDAVRGLQTTFSDALADIGLQIVRLDPPA